MALLICEALCGTAGAGVRRGRSYGVHGARENWAREDLPRPVCGMQPRIRIVRCDCAAWPTLRGLQEREMQHARQIAVLGGILVPLRY